MAVVLVALIGGGYATTYYYGPSAVNIARVLDSGRNINFDKYAPFKPDTATAQLPEAADLHIADIFPRIDCALALYPVVTAFVRAVYDESVEAVHDEPYAKVYSFSPSNRAYDDLISRKTDILLAAVPSAEQYAQAAAAGVELQLTPIGKEAFVFFVNAGNPVDALTTEQLKAIYSGKITGWRQLGGEFRKIRAFQRNTGSGSQTAFENFMGDAPLMRTKETTMGDMGSIVAAAYHNYPQAIGFSFRFFVNEMVDNSEVKLLKIDGVYPDKDTIRDGSYPLTGDFYAITININSNPHLEAFIQWMLSPQGQYLIEASGYVGLGEAPGEQD